MWLGVSHMQGLVAVRCMAPLTGEGFQNANGITWSNQQHVPHVHCCLFVPVPIRMNRFNVLVFLEVVGVIYVQSTMDVISVLSQDIPNYRWHQGNQWLGTRTKDSCYPIPPCRFCTSWWRAIWVCFMCGRGYNFAPSRRRFV